MPRPGQRVRGAAPHTSLAGRLLPPLALMALIFALSAQHNLDSGLGTIDFVGRKIVHATEYGLLFLLWLRALRWRLPALAALISVLYAASDEFHQTFVSGRGGTPRDVLIDTCGVAIAWLLARRLGWLRGGRGDGDG